MRAKIDDSAHARVPNSHSSINSNFRSSFPHKLLASY